MCGMVKKRVALKYCGGCNPTVDRAEYVAEIRSLAGDQIEWVTLDDGNWEKVLLIHGCEAACLEKKFDFLKHGEVLSIRNDNIKPDEIVQNLLREVKNED